MTMARKRLKVPIEHQIHRHDIATRTKPAHRKLKRVYTLPLAGRAVIHTMVHGPVNDVEVKLEGPGGTRIVKAFEPMTLSDACRLLGLDPRAILDLARLQKFTDEMMKQLTARRCLEQARNLGVAMQIRDAVGDGSPHSEEVRLKAAMSIDRAYAASIAPQKGSQVQINNYQNNGAQGAAKPGYVIRLDPLPAKTIEHEAK
jgi:hypothetical protein